MDENHRAGSFGERVRARRRASGLSERALAEAAGLPQPRLHRIETDPNREVSLEDASKLAVALDVRIFWLLDGSPIRDRIVTAARAERTEDAATAVDAVMHLLEVEERLNDAGVAGRQALADVRNPRNRHEPPEEWGQRAAEALRASWGLPSGPLLDLEATVEDATGAYTAYVNMPPGVDGLYLSDELAGTVVLAVDVAAECERQRFTLAHELGHFIANDSHLLIDGGSRTGPAETAANAFARHLLLPLHDVQSYSSTWDERIVGDLAWRYRVSPHAAAIQLRRANLIPDHDVDRYAQLRAKHAAAAGGWWKQRQAELRATQALRVSPSLVERAVRGWQERAIGIRSLARLTGDAPQEVVASLSGEGIHRGVTPPDDLVAVDLDALLVSKG